MGEATSRHDQSHPYRLEVQEVTPVSASILWSLRPPPLSAIPLALLRQKQSSQHHSPSTSNIASSSSLSRLPVNRFASESGLMATRSWNRRVTKVTLRNISPNKQNRSAKQQQQQQVQSKSASSQQHGGDSEDWPSDDGATVVDEDETREEEEIDRERTLDDNADGIEDLEENNASGKIFDSNVSLCVNGVPWSQVMMGDRGIDEAFIVVYGLSPSRDYELVLSVEGKHSTQVSLSTAKAEKEEKVRSSTVAPQQASSADRQANQAMASPVRARAHTPPMQDTDAGNVADSPLEQVHVLNAANSAAVSSALTGVMNASTLQASIRKARKDASRAESALKNEIEAIKRGLERMSDVDHRSKQKVLALQESIRQATSHAKDIEEEALIMEKDRGGWEAEEREKEQELQQVKESVERGISEGVAKIKQDDEEIETFEKELSKVTKALEEKWALKEKLEREKIAEVEQELARVQMEIDNLLRPQPSPASNYMHAFSSSPLPSHLQGMGVPPFAPSQIVSHNKARLGSSTRGGYRSASTPSASNIASRRTPQYRGKGQGLPSASNSQDDSLHEGHALSPSVLNPHKPEFIPAGASPPVVHRLNPQPHTDYSPSTLSRFAYSPTAPLHSTADDEETRRTSFAPLGLSPRPNPTGVSPAASSVPWSAASKGSAAQNHTGTPSLWSTGSVTSSPTIKNDIWGAPSSHPSGAISSSSLRQKTSVPYGLNASLLRGNAVQPAPSYLSNMNREGEAFSPPFVGNSLGQTSPDRRRGSAPVSPHAPSQSHSGRHVPAHGEF